MAKIIEVVDYVEDMRQDIRKVNGLSAELLDCLDEGNVVILDFEGVTEMPLQLISYILGSVYEEYTPEFINRNLQIINLYSATDVDLRIFINNLHHLLG